MPPGAAAAPAVTAAAAAPIGLIRLTDGAEAAAEWWARAGEGEVRELGGRGRGGGRGGRGGSKYSARGGAGGGGAGPRPPPLRGPPSPPPRGGLGATLQQFAWSEALQSFLFAPQWTKPK